MVSDNWTRVPTEQTSDGVRPKLPLTEGQSISLKVLNVAYDSYVVTAACKGQELKSAKHKTIAQLELEEAARKQPQQLQYVKRRINHPLFKNLTYELADAALQSAPAGDVLFRPSSKGPSHLTASVKLTDGKGPLLHIDIAEEDKPSTAEIGQARLLRPLPWPTLSYGDLP